MGQDFRLINGKCRIGSQPNLEVTLIDPNLTAIAATFSINPTECKVTSLGAGTRLLINGTEAGIDSVMRESDSVIIGSVEGYIKWFRF